MGRQAPDALLLFQLCGVSLFLRSAVCKKGKTFVCVNPKRFRFKKAIAAEICSVGIPASIQNLLNVTGMTILNNFTSVYGADAVASMGISYKIYMVPMQITLGFSQGIMPLVSYTFSSGNRRRMKDTILFAMKIMLPILAAMTVLYNIGAGGISVRLWIMRRSFPMERHF